MDENELSDDEFCARCNITPLEIGRASVALGELRRIYKHHSAATPELQRAGESVLEHLRPLREVHSARIRVKNPARLIRKIIRKGNSTRRITLDNYQSQMTDLVGLRALHLFKEDWKAVHDHIIRSWDVAETPIAYYRKGDPDEWVDQFRKKNQVEMSRCRLQHMPLRSFGR